MIVGESTIEGAIEIAELKTEKHAAKQLEVSAKDLDKAVEVPQSYFCGAIDISDAIPESGLPRIPGATTCYHHCRDKTLFRQVRGTQPTGVRRG